MTEAPPTVGKTSRRIPLHVKIILGLILGAAIGLVTNWFVGDSSMASGASAELGASPRATVNWIALNVADPLGNIFLRLIFMVVIPLVFSALTLGVVGLGDLRRIGRIGVRTLGFTVVLSLIAVGIGVTLVNTLKPGATLSPEQRDNLREQYASKAGEHAQKAKQTKLLRDTLLDIIPKNPLQEMVGALDGSSPGNGMLAVMFFALVFGAALTVLPNDQKEKVTGLLESIFEACMVIIGFAMRLAPYAVLCLIFSATSQLGIDVLRIMLLFVITVVVGLLLHLVVVYGITIRLFGGMTARAFFGKVSEAMMTAFATSSSNATLPTALRVASADLKLPREVSHFVLTVGATGNQNGTALYEGVVVLFLAQVFGVDLTVGQQITVVLMSVLAGVGTAGVPGGSLPLIMIVLQSVHVPAEGIALILGVDRILDMCRTVLNVTGDLTIATCVANGEKRASKSRLPAHAPA